MNADLIIQNGAVYTADEAQKFAEAVAIAGNKIMFVGSNEDVKRFLSADTQIIDAKGKTVMPGIIDSHFHVIWGAKSLAAANLYGVQDLEGVQTAIDTWLKANPEKSWVMGNGMSYAIPSDQVSLDRHHLDAIVSDRPMMLMAFDMHAAWLNTKGMELTGLLHGHPPLPGDAEVVMGKDGLATGALIEPAAYELAIAKLPEQTDAEKLAELRLAMHHIAAYGITTVHDMACNAEDMRLFSLLEESGELTTRIYSNQLIEPEHSVEDIKRLAVPLRENYTSDFLRVGFIKFFMDGVYESYTAVTLNGYPERPDFHGEPIFSAEQFAALVAEADRLGFQIAVHACGDGAVRRVLDGYEQAQIKNGRRDSRHRIEHIEMATGDEIGRFAELGVVASMQPLHAPIGPIGSDIWVSRIHESEIDNAFPWRAMRNAAIPLSFGSDWPVVTLDPFLGFHAALNRQPQIPGANSHNQTLEETLNGYTRDAAWVEFAEETKGQLKAGYLADIILLSHDLFKTPTEKIAETHVELTIVNGKVVFEKP